MQNAVYAAIDRHRIERGVSMTKFAREIGVAYDTAWNTLKRGTVPHDYNRVKFERYYLAHEAEISALMKAEPAEVAP